MATKKTNEATVKTSVKKETKKDIENNVETVLVSDVIVDSKENTEENTVLESQTFETETKGTEIEDSFEKEIKELSELTEEFSNAEKNIEELLKDNANNLPEALDNELKRVEEIEKKVLEEIKINETKLKKKPRSNFGNFWNGVSDGWNN